MTLAVVLSATPYVPSALAQSGVTLYTDEAAFAAATGMVPVMTYPAPRSGTWDQPAYIEWLGNTYVTIEPSNRAGYNVGDHTNKMPGNEYNIVWNGPDELAIRSRWNQDAMGFWLMDRADGGCSKPSNFKLAVGNIQFSIDTIPNEPVFIGLQYRFQFHKVTLIDTVSECKGDYIGQVWSAQERHVVGPPPTDPFLKTLNTRFPYAHGGATPGAPISSTSETPPPDRETLEQRRAEGNFSVWVIDPPTKFDCCDRLFLDLDTLDGQTDLNVDLVAAMNLAVPIEEFHDVTDAARDAISARLDYSGAILHDIEPVTGLGDATTFYTAIDAELVTTGGGGGAAAAAEAPVTHPSSGVLEMHGLNSASLKASLFGPTVEKELEWDRTFSVKMWGPDITVGAELDLALAFQPSVEAGVGVGFAADRIEPTFIVVGLEGAVEGSAAIEGELEFTPEIEAELNVQGAASLSLAGEAFVPIDPANIVGDRYRSLVTEIEYTDLSRFTGAAVLGPFALDIQADDLRVEFYDFEFFVPIGSALDVELGPWILVFGAGTIDAGFGRTISVGAFGGAPGGPAASNNPSIAMLGGPAERYVTFAPDAATVPFTVHGTPGTQVPVAFETPIAFLHQNGTATVGTFAFTSPPLALGADGEAQLMLDPGAWRAAAQEALFSEGGNTSAALTHLDAIVDLDGDLVPDANAAALTDDDRAALVLTMEATNTRGDEGRLVAGEDVTIEVRAVHAKTGASPSGILGEATIMLGGEPLGTVILQDGLGSVSLSVPGGLAARTANLSAVYPGNATYKASLVGQSVDLTDEPPQILTLTPAMFTRFDGASNPILEVEVHATPAQDIDAASATIEVAGTAFALGETTPGIWSAAIDTASLPAPLEEGFAWLTAHLTDTTGQEAQSSTALVVDREAPAVTFDAADVIVSADRNVVVPWHASEPVTVRGTLQPLVVGSEQANDTYAQSAPFERDGTVAWTGIEPGIYRASYEVRDTAGRGRDGEIPLPDHIVVVV